MSDIEDLLTQMGLHHFVLCLYGSSAMGISNALRAPAASHVVDMGPIQAPFHAVRGVVLQSH